MFMTERIIRGHLQYVLRTANHEKQRQVLVELYGQVDELIISLMGLMHDARDIKTKYLQERDYKKGLVALESIKGQVEVELTHLNYCLRCAKENLKPYETNSALPLEFDRFVSIVEQEALRYRRKVLEQWCELNNPV